MKWMICSGILSVLWLVWARLDLRWWEYRDEMNSGGENEPDKQGQL